MVTASLAFRIHLLAGVSGESLNPRLNRARVARGGFTLRQDQGEPGANFWLSWRLLVDRGIFPRPLTIHQSTTGPARAFVTLLSRRLKGIASKMTRSAYSRRAFALYFVFTIVLTVAAKSSLKDGTTIRLSNGDVEEKLQVGAHIAHCLCRTPLPCWKVADGTQGMLNRPVAQRRQASQCPGNFFVHSKAVRSALSFIFTCYQRPSSHRIHLWTA